LTKRINTHQELEVYQLAFKSASQIFELSKSFPSEEKYSLTDQIRRSSRSVCANIAECFRKRLYPKSFISKISDAEGEAAETQTWLEFANACDYLSIEESKSLISSYDHIIGKLVIMRNNPDHWSI